MARELRLTRLVIRNAAPRGSPKDQHSVRSAEHSVVSVGHNVGSEELNVRNGGHGAKAPEVSPS